MKKVNLEAFFSQLDKPISKVILKPYTVESSLLFKEAIRRFNEAQELKYRKNKGLARP